MTAAISRCGLTGSAMRASSLRRSSSAMKVLMSGNMGALSSGDGERIGHARGQGQGAPAIGAGHARRATASNRVDEVVELEPQRFVSGDRYRPALNRRPVVGAMPQAPDFKLLRPV